MAIDFGSLSMRLSPLAPINIGNGDGMERERLKLMREQFENQKKQQEEENRLRKLAEAGEMERARMQGERERAKAEAKAAAKLQEQKLAAYQKFTELNGAGDLAGARSMVPLMSSLGMGVEDQGEVGGFPRYRISMDAQQDAKAEDERNAQASPYGQNESAVQSLSRLSALGLQGETGTLDDPQTPERAARADLALSPGETERDASVEDALSPGDADMATAAQYAGADGGVTDVDVGARGMMPASLPGSDAYAQALAASQYARDNEGKPLRAPSEEDYTGAVPSDVIDTGAQHQLTLATLKPGLKSLAEAYPDPESRASAALTAAGIEAMPLSGTKALEEYDKQRGGPDNIMVANRQQDAQAARFRETRDQVTPMDISTFRMRGAEQAEKLAKNRGVADVLSAVRNAGVAESVLDDDDPNNDTMIAPALMEAQGVKGVPSNTDLAYALGMDKASTITQIVARVKELIVGGMSTAQKNAIKSYLHAVQESQKATVHDYLESAFGRVDSGELNQYEAAGYKGAIEESVPAWMYNDYWSAREKREGKSGKTPAAGGAPGAAGAELQRQADGAGLNGQVLGQLMSGESGGDPKAANENRTDGAPKSSAKGVFQLLDSTAKTMGFKDAADYAAQPLDKQIEVGLKLFKNKGITADSPPEDYALVLAAPSFVGKWKSRDDVVYKKDSDEWKGNAPWRPADGGDITVGSIADYYLRQGKAEPAKAAVAAPEATLPEPKTAAEKRIVELLKKRGG